MIALQDVFYFTIYEVMSLIGLSTDKMRSSSGGYYDCPVCGKKGKFNINPSIGYGGVVRCAACNVGGDKVDLYVIGSGGSYSLITARSKSGSFYERPSEQDRMDALKEIARRLHIERKSDGFITKNFAAKKKIEEASVKESNSLRPGKEIDRVYRTFLSMLTLSKAHREKLRERGLSDENIEQMLFKTTPTFRRPQFAQALISQGLSLEGIPGFFKLEQVNEGTGEFTEEWSVYCPDSGYFVPIKNESGLIISMQIRLNKPTTERDKYRFFSSNRDSLESGTKADGATHVEMCSEEPRFLYIVEGAIKAYVARALYNLMYRKDDIIILAIPGVSNLREIPYHLDWVLGNYNVDRVVEWFDLDKFTNPNVAKARDNLERVVKENMLKWREKRADEYETGVIRPPGFVSFQRKNYKGKGIDDHLFAIWNEWKATYNNNEGA
jgi:hypothetical protein